MQSMCPKQTAQFAEQAFLDSERNLRLLSFLCCIWHPPSARIHHFNNDKHYAEK